MLQLGLGLELGPGNVFFPLSYALTVTANIHGVRTTTVRDVTMMYCQKWYMENVPLWVSKIVKLFSNVPGFSWELIGLVAATEL